MAAPGTRLRAPSRPAGAPPRPGQRRSAPPRSAPRVAPRVERRPSAPVESFRRPWSARRAGAAARATVISFSQIDGWLLALIAGLCAFGLVMVYSASEALGYAWYGNPSFFFQRQLVWLGVGVPVMLVTARVDYHRWARWSRPLGVATLVLLVLVLVPHIGSERLGARRWFTLGPLSVQPSAVATLVAIVWFSRWLTERGAAMRVIRTVRQYGVLLCGLLLAVVMERDLGSAVVLAAIGVVLAALGGVRKRHLAQLAGGLMVLGWLAIHMESYRSSRLQSFLHPFSDPMNTGFQSVQSLYALGSGGLGGVGLGNSIQKFQWLPEAHTDFIFAIVGEELGLIGCLSIIAAFFVLGWRGVRVSMRAPDGFGALLAGGIIAWICIQAFINIAAVTTVLPTTGIPLPFISSGGTSLLMTLVACGVLFNISAQGREQGSRDVRTLIAGGGTGGHLTPALAVAQTLRRTDPAGEVMLAGRRGGLEERMVPAAGLPLVTLRVRGVDSSRPLSAALALARLLPAVLAARRILRDFAADVVVGAAGYVCVPVVLAARSLRIPVVLMEQNAVPGRAVRLLSGSARAVAASFAETAERLPRTRVVHTGNPVREEVSAAAPAPLGEACDHLLVMGGSQGAQRINRALGECLVALLEAHPRLRVTHQCGARDAQWAAQLAATLSEPLRSRYTVAAFFDDIAGRIRDADLVVMRAGGSSLAEVSVLGRPMLLVPYPHARAHQVDNALPYVRCGAAGMLSDEECTGERLRTEVEAITADPTRWREMARASAAAGRPDAARRVADLLAEVALSR